MEEMDTLEPILSARNQDDLAQKRGVCDLFLPPAFFTFQNITDDYRGIDTVKKRQCFFLIQTDIGDSRHSAESYIGIKYLTQFIMFPVFVEYLFAESPSALCISCTSKP